MTPPPSFSPTKADLFTFKNNTKNVLLRGLLLSFIESSFLFSLSALWLDENCKKKKKIGEPLLWQSPIPPEIPDLLKWAHWSQVYNIYLKQEIGLYDCRTVSWAISPPSFSCSFSVVSYMRNSRVPSGRHGSPSVRHTASRSAQWCSGRVHHPLSSSSVAGHAWQDQRGASPWVSSQTSGTVLLFSVCRVSAVWYYLSFHAYGKKKWTFCSAHAVSQCHMICKLCRTYCILVLFLLRIHEICSLLPKQAVTRCF